MRSRKARLGLFAAIAITGSLPGTQSLLAQNTSTPSPDTLPNDPAAATQSAPATTPGGRPLTPGGGEPGSFTRSGDPAPSTRPASSSRHGSTGGGFHTRASGLNGAPDNPDSHPHSSEGFNKDASNKASTFDWSRFFSGAAQSGSRYAAHDLQDTAAGPGKGGAGSAGALNLGSNLLHSMASASGGSLGSSLNAASHYADLPRSGFSMPLGDSTKGTSGAALNLHLTGIPGSNFGGISRGGSGMGDPMQGSFSGTGGAEGSGSMFGTPTGMNNGINSFGSGINGMGGGHGGRGGGANAPGVSVKLKF